LSKPTEANLPRILLNWQWIVFFLLRKDSPLCCVISGKWNQPSIRAAHSYLKIVIAILYITCFGL
jgi:hypothetical protein